MLSTQTQPADQNISKHITSSCKHLLAGLINWSKHKTTDEHVSDLYITLVGHIESLHSTNTIVNETPDRLRIALEKMLEEEQSEKTVQIHGEDVRICILQLMTALKEEENLINKQRKVNARIHLRQATLLVKVSLLLVIIHVIITV